MLCQKCHKKTASVFISSMINGQETRIYLCDDCIKDYKIPNFNYQAPFSIKDVMDKLKIDEEIHLNKENSLLIENDSDKNDITCSSCYTTYNDYRQTGKLGCSRCYEVFEEYLKPVLKNIHGYEEYIGKTPKKDDDIINISREIKVLKEDLNMAIEKEEYEKAADIRDKIKDLEERNE